MKMLSLNIPSTYENWIKLSTAVFGPESAPTKFLVGKASIEGIDTEILADEAHLLHVLGQMFIEEYEEKSE